MKKMSGKNFIVIIMTIFVAVTLMSYAKADAQWEAQWQKTLAAGKKEGKVSVYVSSISPGVRKQAPIFAKQFGIELEVTAGRGNALLRRLSTEKKAGLNLADVVIGGGISVLAIKQAGVSGPMENKLILPEVIDPKLWYTQDRLPWLDDAKHFILFYAYPNRDVSINTDLVKPGEIQSWQDLLSPQFKGRIVWSDPTIPGSGSNGFCTNIMNNVLDENYYRKLVATQDITLNRDLRQMAEWLAKGKYAVAVSIPGGTMSQFFNAGAHVEYVRVKEGTYLSPDGGGLGIAAEAPHPNAAMVFVNWLLSRDGQIFAQKATNYMSARNDIPTEGIVNPRSMRIPGEKYFVSANTLEKWIYEDQDKCMALVKDIFRPLTGR